MGALRTARPDIEIAFGFMGLESLFARPRTGGSSRTGQGGQNDARRAGAATDLDPDRAQNLGEPRCGAWGGASPTRPGALAIRPPRGVPGEGGQVMISAITCGCRWAAKCTGCRTRSTAAALTGSLPPEANGLLRGLGSPMPTRRSSIANASTRAHSRRGNWRGALDLSGASSNAGRGRRHRPPSPITLCAENPELTATTSWFSDRAALGRGYVERAACSDRNRLCGWQRAGNGLAPLGQDLIMNVLSFSGVPGVSHEQAIADAVARLNPGGRLLIHEFRSPRRPHRPQARGNVAKLQHTAFTAAPAASLDEAWLRLALGRGGAG